MKRRRFDSDDDDDEFIATENGPLSEFPSAAHHEMMLEMGYASSESDVAAVPVGGEGESGHHSEGEGAAPPPPTASSNSTEPVVRKKTTSQHPEDTDIPREWAGLLSDTLLRVYYTPLSYLQSQRTMDDTLLAQYLPFDPNTVLPLSSEAEGDDVHSGRPKAQYLNRFGIAPGWRWDGIVRGRKDTENL